MFTLPVTLALILSLLPHPAAAPEAPIDLNVAARYFGEAEAACARDAGRLWALSPCGPILFVDRATRAAVANRVDAEGLLVKKGDVYVGRLPDKQPVANYAAAWAGVRWAVIDWATVSESQFLRVKLILHESFHRVQGQLNLPLAFSANDHLDTRDGRVWLRLEWRALRRALVTGGAARRRALTDALTFRSYRRALFPTADETERALEMHEGLAEYTGYRLAAQNDAELIRQLAEYLDRLGERPSFVGSFAYASGPAYGVLLDASGAQWRRGLTPRHDLGVLSQRAYRIELPRDLKGQATRRAAGYDGERLMAAEDARDLSRQKQIAAYRASLVDGPTLLLELSEKGSVALNTNNLVPIEGVGMVHPTATVTDEWGTLEVTNGALMVRERGRVRRVYVTSPADIRARPATGDGWTLRLAQGWTITTGLRDGDYTLERIGQKQAR